MEYEFRSTPTGGVNVRMSMGHEALAAWFNEEVDGDLRKLDEIEKALNDAPRSRQDTCYPGREYSLWIDNEEVSVNANRLNDEDDEPEEGMNYYDQESQSCCGIEDFLSVVAAYRHFS